MGKQRLGCGKEREVDTKGDVGTERDKGTQGGIYIYSETQVNVENE